MKNAVRKILKILHEEDEPLKLGEIAARLNKEKNTTHYYLKKLTDPERKTLDSKDGYYWIGDREKVKKAILDLLFGSEQTETDMYRKLEEKGITEDEVYDVLFLLEQEGHIKVEKPEKLSGVKDAIYSLSISGYSKRGICIVCKDEIDSSEDVLTALYRQSLAGHTWKTATIHKDCFPDSKAEFIINGRIEGDVFCDHCGLPLSPKMITLPVAGHHLLYDHFTRLEVDTIEWVEFLYHNFPDSSSEEELIEFYDELDKGFNGGNDFTPIPYQTEEEAEFILALIGKRCDIHDFRKLRSKLLNLGGLDLSRRDFAEDFMTGLMEFFPEVPENYDIESRIEAIWKAAHKIIRDHETDIRRLYEPLLGPIGGIYNRIPPQWVIYDDHRFSERWNRRSGADLRNMEGDHGKDLYSQVITIRSKGKVYHPYCAEKIKAEKEGHPDDKNERR